MKNTIQKITKTISAGVFALVMMASVVGTNVFAVLKPEDGAGTSTGTGVIGTAIATAKTGNTDTAATGISTIIVQIGQILAFLIVALSVIYILLGAYNWMQGKEEDGKKMLRNAVIGLVVALAAFVIAQGAAYLASAFLK
jgi:uncharacterized membrane protein YidH (DUF202 family)